MSMGKRIESLVEKVVKQQIVDDIAVEIRSKGTSD